MKTINVVAALLVKNNEILIAQRVKGDFAGMWEFPGGKIEENETPQEALKREIMEELEVDIQVGDYLMTANYEYPNFILKMDCFFCIMSNESITLHDHNAVKWIDIKDEIDLINWVPADIQVINKVKEHYKNQ